MMVTHETITDEQIRELRRVAVDCGNRTFLRVADISLGEWHPDDAMVGIDRELIVLGARVRCAGAWNLRHGGDE